MPEFEERRRTPRATLPAGHELGLKIKAPIRLLDISQSGALVSSELPTQVGTKGQLQGVLDHDSFSVEVTICRQADPPPADFPERATKFGAVFTALDARSSEQLKRFLDKAGT